jgi:branched-chain amino acid transport system ATP-binding protein
MIQMLLEVRGLSVRFGGLAALDQVDFDIKAGEIVGIIGPNGAGKTTLFNSLMGIQRTAEGSVVFDGHPLKGLRPNRVTKAGMVKTFQNAALFPEMSVMENVVTSALVRHDMAEARVVASSKLEQLGLMPIADQDVETLTFPQKAMVELARSLSTEPKLLLLDEVMAALTHTEMDEVIAVIHRLRGEGLSFLVVEHHMRALMALCDRLLFFNFGRLVADGKPSEIIEHPEVIKAYLGSSGAAAGGGHHA